MRRDRGRYYLERLVELTDTIVIDGRINTVVAGTSDQRRQLDDRFGDGTGWTTHLRPLRESRVGDVLLREGSTGQTHSLRRWCGRGIHDGRENVEGEARRRRPSRRLKRSAVGSEDLVFGPERLLVQVPKTNASPVSAHGCRIARASLTSCHNKSCSAVLSSHTTGSTKHSHQLSASRYPTVT